jgi:glycosyltransferase involved in cell wall biosynthesis
MISVCMAVFNGEPYLFEQLRSILAQLDDEDEVIIVSDCSRDGSVELIEKIGDPRVALYQNDANVGPAVSFERAITQAKGQYIFLSDQDDVWRPDKVRITRQIFESTGALAVVSDAQIVDAELNAMMSSLFLLRSSGPGFWRNLYRNGFVGCCMAFRSDARSFLIPFPAHVGLHDEWIGLCSSIAGNVIFCDHKLIDYRRHGENVSSLGHGSLISMTRKRFNLALSVLRRLPRILKWRFAN